MAAPNGSQSSTHRRSTVYESCKKIIDARNRFHKLQSQMNFSDSEFKKTIQQNCKSQNEYLLQACQQYESQLEEDNNEEFILSDVEKMPNKYELCAENVNSYLEQLSTMNEVILEQETDSLFNKNNTEINSWLKSEKTEVKLIVCPKCEAHFEKRTELALHFKQFHLKKRGRPAVPVECDICQKKFTCKKDYAIHFRNHSTKPYACPSCKKMCFVNVPHSCKKVKYEKPKGSVWDACKKVLTDKSFQQAPSEDSKFFVPKVPISKKVVFMNTSPNEVDFKNLKIPLHKVQITNFTPHLKGNKTNNSSVNISYDQNSAEQLVSQYKNIYDLQLDNLANIQTAATNVTEINNSEFFCNICDISFDEMEKYEAHYSTHLCDEFCQIREGDEELHVCNVCGKCFTELNAFQAHQFTHANKNDLL